jgi:hypothetical protein
MSSARRVRLSLIAIALTHLSCSPGILGPVTSACDPTTDGVSICRHRLFVTSSSHFANFGGLSGADSLCASAAQGAGLTRTYRALLADSTTPVTEHVELSKGVSKYSADGSQEVILSETAADLFSGFLLSEPDTDENGDTISSGRAFTGFNATGGTHANAGTYCNNWNTVSIDDAPVGFPNIKSGIWAELTSQTHACTNHRLYCISQP